MKPKKKIEKRIIEIEKRLKSQFSDEELEEYKSAFSFFDPKGKGYISKDDLNMIFLTQGKMILESDQEMILKDVGHILEDTEIDFNTFLKTMIHVSVEQTDSLSDIKECFMSLKDENEDIPVEKFKHVMTNLLNKLTMPEVNEILSKLDITTKTKYTKEDGEEKKIEYDIIKNENKLYELMITKKY